MSKPCNDYLYSLALDSILHKEAMSNLTHGDLKGDYASHLEKHESPELCSIGCVDIPAGYFPVTVEEKALSRALNLKLDFCLLPW